MGCDEPPSIQCNNLHRRNIMVGVECIVEIDTILCISDFSVGVVMGGRFS